MPAVAVARGQHHTIFFNPERGHLNPGDLNGRKVGVRAYTQTTGAWVRGFLQEDYGVDFQRVQWITFEDPHIAEFTDPPWVQRRQKASSCCKCCSMAKSTRPFSEAKIQRARRSNR